MSTIDHSDQPWSHLHVGRSWTGDRLEAECPCPKEACGLVDVSNANGCPEHDPQAGKTIRQAHRADQCPGVAT